MGSYETEPHPLTRLDSSDLDFVLQLVLASGSLKDVAAAYGVSYPTIRGRLDRLIARVRQVLAGKAADVMAETLADLVERGEVTTSAARSILDLHRRAIQATKEHNNERTGV